MRLAPFLLLACVAAASASDDGLVAWTPSVPLPFEREEGRREAAILREKLIDALQRKRTDDRTLVVELEDLFLEPAAYLGKRVAFLSELGWLHLAAPRPDCALSSGGAAPHLMTAIAGLSLDQKESLVRFAASGEKRLLLFEGVLRSTVPSDAGSPIYLEGEAFRDLGVLPPRYSEVIADILELREPATAERVHASWKRAKALAASAEQDAAWPAVPIETLTKDPASFVGRPLSVLATSLAWRVRAGRGALILSDTFMSRNGIIEAQMPKESPGTLKRRIRETPFFSVVAVKGRVARGGAGAYYFEADSLSEVCRYCALEDLRNPAWPPAAPPREDQELEPEREAALAKAGVQARAALERVRKQGRHPIVELEELLLDPVRFLDKEVAVFGLLTTTQKGPRGLYGDFGYAYRWALTMAALFERVPAEAKERLPKPGAPAHPMPAVLLGRVRSEDGLYYLDASEVLETVPLTIGLPETSYRILEPDPIPRAGASDRAKAAVAAARKDPDRLYVPFADLLLRPRELVGRKIAAVGLAMDFIAGDAKPRFSFSAKTFGIDAIPAHVAGLPLAERKRWLRLAGANRPILLRAELREEPNGALYLVPESFVDLGPDEEAVAAAFAL